MEHGASSTSLLTLKPVLLRLPASGAQIVIRQPCEAMVGRTGHCLVFPADLAELLSLAGMLVTMTMGTAHGNLCSRVPLYYADHLESGSQVQNTCRIWGVLGALTT